ncbi:hypothetical protein BDN72DRAFT_320900 [Pluteus cervinus]|uniref:Uncharacterized protein n=1 Tax=Pluteus cervinus TaxID=181527 RepID=A0ACD3ACL0_9AGAR|nr:hypothetical protein BDN72DRAFT_320900 [Pluteus cervinus]
MPRSSDFYESLPTNEHSDARIRIRRPPWTGRFIRPLECRPNFSLSLAAILFFGAVLLFTVDLTRLRGTDVLSDAHATLFSHFWPVGLPNRTDSWENENSKTMRALFTCTAEGSCKENQTSVVLMSSSHFKNSIAGKVSGEDIWAMSVIIALRELGYSAIFAPDNYELARTYRQYPDLVKVVILEGSSAKECFKSSECVKKPNHPLGIPAWKMLSFHFWTGSSHPLGNQWTLSPENYGILSPGNSINNTYLGYSIERTCMRRPVTPIAKRPNQVYILAKRLSYFREKGYSWPDISFDQAPFPLQFVAGLTHDVEPDEVPGGIIDVGRLNQTQFYDHLGNSRLLLGIGRPPLSPSPYDALCLAVPFINPVENWDHDQPDNRTRWWTQHDGLKFLDPPYVYNVKKNDVEGFWKAIRMALDTPIERYIVPEMTMGSLKYRLGNIIERDWRGMALGLLEERKASGNGELFEI